MNIASILINNLLLKIRKDVNSSSTKIDALSRSLASVEDSPAFYTISAYSNTEPIYTVYSHDMKVLAKGTKNNSSTVTSQTSESGNNYYLKAASNSYPSSSANYGSSSAACGILGHIILDIASDLGSMKYKHPIAHNISRHAGNRVGSRKHANTIPMLKDGKTLFLSPRTSYQALHYSKKGIDVPSMNPSKGNGGVCFNSNTNRVVFVQTVGDSAVFRIVYADMTKDISEYTDIQAFIDEFELNKITTSNTYTTASSSGGTANYRYPSVAVCDNGDVYVSHLVSSLGLSTISIPYVANAYGAGVESLIASSTTVGNDETGLQHNISNNGRYVITYSPYYYYGAGINMTILDTVTSRIAKTTKQQTTYGLQPIPFNEDYLLLNHSTNADGNVGHSVYHLDLKAVFASSAAQEFSFPLPTAVNQEIDNGYYSTDYPYMIQCTTQDFELFYNEGAV